MVARVTPDRASGEHEISDLFAREGLRPHSWSNGPGDRYGWHSHPYHKVLYCVRGSIVFRTRDGGEHRVTAGDRLDIDAGTEHAADVGPDGVTCMEAAR